MMSRGRNLIQVEYKQSMFTYVFQKTNNIEIDNVEEDEESKSDNIWISTDEISRRTLILNHYFHKWRDLVAEIKISKEMARIHCENKLKNHCYSRWKSLAKQSKEREVQLMILAQGHYLKVLKRYAFNGWLRIFQYTKELMNLKNLKLQRSSITQKIEQFCHCPNIVPSHKTPSIYFQKNIQNEKVEKPCIQKIHSKTTKLLEKPVSKFEDGNINLRLEKEILDLLDIKKRLRHGRAIPNQVALKKCKKKVILSKKDFVLETKAWTTTLDEQMNHVKRLSSLPDRSSSVTPIRNIITE